MVQLVRQTTSLAGTGHSRPTRCITLMSFVRVRTRPAVRIAGSRYMHSRHRAHLPSFSSNSAAVQSRFSAHALRQTRAFFVVFSNSTLLAPRLHSTPTVTSKALPSYMLSRLAPRCMPRSGAGAFAYGRFREIILCR